MSHQSPEVAEKTHPEAPKLALPAPVSQTHDNRDGGDAPSDDQPTTLTVNGQSVSLFDKLGPTVVNSDGTLSRIGNWAELLPHERANVLRVLGKRNQIRLQDKKNQLEQQQATDSI
ncbi:hypothetical protein OIV83_004016 [Microbotryomycetes sp. JL201]|nr:hypothetical protein OIV83_004016 [Microbotryomycetes sp. JL201]